MVRVLGSPAPAVPVALATVCCISGSSPASFVFLSLYSIARFLATSPIEIDCSFTNFILVHTGGDSSQLAGALLKKGVIIRDMAAWGLKGYIRVSIGSASENKRFIKTLGEVL